MRIRTARKEDALALSSLCADVQRLHAQRYPQIFKQPEREDFAAAYFAEMLADPAVRIFIAEEGDASAGYVFCRLIERPENAFNFAFRLLMIEHVSVRPALQGRGIGAALMAEAEALARDLDMPRIQLDSWDFNTGAHGFFESQGFQKFNYRFWKQL
jgi:ribosomal protein S18 acetylase RimI-like enzyme